MTFEVRCQGHNANTSKSINLLNGGRLETLVSECSAGKNVLKMLRRSQALLLCFYFLPSFRGF